jgi:hypothetical protein
MDPKYCRTCGHKLQPVTSVPNMSPDMLELNSNQAYYDGQIEKRKKELANGEVGFLGEGQFCGQMCAGYYGRACVALFAELETGTIKGSILPEAVRNVLNLFPWVKKRKGK